VVGFVNSDTSGPLAGASVAVNVLKIPDQSLPPCQRRVLEGDDRFIRKTATTDERGYFEVKGFNPDMRVFSVEAVADHYVPAFLQPGSPFVEVQHITLKTGSEVLLLVRDGLADAPVNNFRYRFASSWAWGVGWEHPFMSWSQSDASGKALVKLVPPGEWEIEVEELNEAGVATGRRAQAVQSVECGRDVVTVTLGGTGAITGKVVADMGAPIPGARVRVYPYYAAAKSQSDTWGTRKDAALSGLLLGTGPSEGVLGTAVTQPDGTFEVGGLTPGKYEVIADTDDLVSAKRMWVEVPATGGSRPVTIGISKAAGVYGRVRAEDGTFVRGAEVRILQSTYGGVPLARTDKDGYYAIRHLRPDWYKLAVEGHNESVEEVTLRPGEQRELDFDLSGRLSVSGRVTANAQPWRSKPYRLFLRQKAKGYPAMYDQDVGFELSTRDLKDGSYTAVVPVGDYYLWANYRDNRWLIADTVSINRDAPGTRDIALQHADLSVVVLDEHSKAFDQGVVCFHQRIPSHVEPRVFSKNLRDQQSYFPDMLAGEYKVSFTSTDGRMEGESDWVSVGPGNANAIVVHARPLELGTAIGTWNPTNASAVPADHSFSAEPVVDGAGTYQVYVMYEWGHHGMRIESVSLFEDEREIAIDAHEGWSGTGKRHHGYRLALPAFDPARNYAVAVRMKSEGGTISQGTVYMDKITHESTHGQ
jgi:hypothetical protein